MDAIKALITGDAPPIEFPGQGPTRLTKEQAENQRKLSEYVPFTESETKAFFKQLENVVTMIDDLACNAKEKHFGTLAGLLCNLETPEALPFKDRLVDILQTGKGAKEVKVTMKTYWKLQFILFVIYDHLAECWRYVATVPDDEYQLQFTQLETTLKTLLVEIYSLPPAKHVNRISLKFKPDVASTTYLSDMDTVIDITYGLPPSIISDEQDNREDGRMELVHSRRGVNISLNSSSESMSKALDKALCSIPWEARLSQTRKTATVTRFQKMMRELSGKDAPYVEIPRSERKKVSSSDFGFPRPG